ncbi:MAG: hypothetical protein GF330_00460 [Candidatus Eisenbacteria bacterium]|nr:hypothetical protein [Candidatus Eisenbacteria bacterium]
MKACRPGRILRGVGAGEWLIVVALLACCVGTTRAYEHRRGIPSVGGQLQRGYLGFDSDWTNVYEWGKGGTISVRQYVARNRAIGFSFEQQKFYRIKDLPQEGTWNPDALQLQMLMLDYYFYFNRLRKWTYYLVLSAGAYRPEEIDNADQGDGLQVNYPSENVLARVGWGLERFLRRTVSIDASLSFYYINAPGIDGVTGSAQLALGVHVYAGR